VGAFSLAPTTCQGGEEHHDSPDRTSCCPRVHSRRRDHTGVGTGHDATGGEAGAGRHQQRLARRAEGGEGHRRGGRQEDRREPALQEHGRARTEEGDAEGDLRQDQGPDRRQVGPATRTGRQEQVGRFLATY